MSRKNQKYWRRRAIQQEKDWTNRCKQTIEKQLAAHYQQALIAIKDDILKLYGSFANANGLNFDEAQQLIGSKEFREWRMTMQEYLQRIADGEKGLERELNTLAMRPRINRLEKLYAETLQELDKLGRNVNDDIRNFLSDSYKSTYAKNIFDLVKVGGLSVALSKLDSIAVEKVIASRWSGKNFSQRIWTNTKLLSGVLRETISSGVHRGLSIPQMSKMIEDKMNGGYRNAVRLVRTEMNFVNNQAHADSMKDAGVEQYEFMAVMDGRTSQKCRERDGEHFLLEEKVVGENYPPLHPRCRSTVCPFIEGVSRKGTRTAKDSSGKNIEIPSAMKYADYEKVYLKKELTFDEWKEARQRKPLFRKVDYSDVAKERSLEEFTKMGQELKPVAEKYIDRPSKWNGTIVFRDQSAKYWNCNIWLEPDSPKHIVLHEMIHSCSASYFDKETFMAHVCEEELAVQLLCQEISLREGIQIVKGPYDDGVELIRDFKKALRSKQSDLEFAQNLINQPMPERWGYLESLMAKSVADNFTIEDYTKLLEKLEAVKSWLPPQMKK